MLPEWFTKPEAIFRTLLWLLGPFLTWVIGKFIISRLENWYAERSLKSAKSSLEAYRWQIENPPTLLESVALIACLVPIPLAFLSVGLFFLNPPGWVGFYIGVNSPEFSHAAQMFRNTAFF